MTNVEEIQSILQVPSYTTKALRAISYLAKMKAPFSDFNDSLVLAMTFSRKLDPHLNCLVL